MFWHDIVGIDGNYVGDFDGARISVAESRCAVSGDLILGKDPLSLFNFAFAETSAALGRAIPDDIDGTPAESRLWVAARRFEPQAGAFTSTRHNSLIRSMLASVV
jgi:hypothetical protein